MRDGSVQVRNLLTSFIIVLIGLGLVLTVVLYVVNSANTRSAHTDHILDAVFSLNLITNDYILFSEDRSFQQWEQQHDAIGALFIDAPEVDEADQERLATPYNDLDNRFRLFADNVATEQYGVTVQQRLITEIQLSLHDLASEVSRIKERTTMSVRNSLFVLYTLIPLFFVGLTVSFWAVARLVRRRTKELSDAKAQDEAILSSMGDGLVVIDADGRIVLANEAASELLHMDQETLLQKTWQDTLHVVDDAGTPAEPSDQPVQEALVNQEVATDAHHNIPRPDGSLLPVSITAARVQTTQGFVGVVVVMRDITIERDIDRAKTEFVSMAAHQLRTPLTSMNWYTEMMLTGDAGDLTEDQKTFLDEVAAGSERLTRLVNSLLNVSRLELGTFSVQPEPVDVCSFIDQQVKDIEIPARDKKIEIQKRCSKRMPQQQADKNLLGIIMHNLLTNAVKYTPQGGTVALTAEVDKKAGNEVVLTVSDTGRGIPPEQQPKIFSKLFRADNVDEIEGTGLGLYIVRSILTEVGGSIAFTSKVGEGTTFTVRLPAGGMKAREGSRKLNHEGE